MTAHKPTYFLTPPRPEPTTGRIRLGAIIPSPTHPDEPLYHPPLPSTTDISTFTEHKWSGAYVKDSSFRFGVWTSFLEMVLSFGLDVNVKIDKHINQNWEVESMTTLSFHPSRAFLEEVVQHEEVREYIKSTWFNERIYMITGVMIAESTTSFRESLEKRSVYIHAGVDATAWAGIPISAGPEGKWKRKIKLVEKSQRDEEFVFAYRVREVKVRKRDGGIKADRLYSKGALFSTEQEGDKEEEEVEFVGLDEEFELEDELEIKEVTQDTGTEGEEECICVLPEPQ